MSITVSKAVYLEHIKERLDRISDHEKRRRDYLVKHEDRVKAERDKLDEVIVTAFDVGGLPGELIAEFMGYSKSSAWDIIKKARERIEERRVEVR